MQPKFNQLSSSAKKSNNYSDFRENIFAYLPHEEHTFICYSLCKTDSLTLPFSLNFFLTWNPTTWVNTCPSITETRDHHHVCLHCDRSINNKNNTVCNCKTAYVCSVWVYEGICVKYFSILMFVVKSILVGSKIQQTIAKRQNITKSNFNNTCTLTHTSERKHWTTF